MKVFKLTVAAMLLFFVTTLLAAQEVAISAPATPNVVVDYTLIQNQPSGSATVQLMWDPNSEADLAGYKVYFGKATRVYEGWQTIGKVTTHTLRLVNSTYFFAVTAYNTAGLESGYSNEVSAIINLPDKLPPATPLNLRQQIIQAVLQYLQQLAFADLAYK